MTDRIALFIDGANLHRAVRNLGFEIDFSRLLKEFSSFGWMVRAFFYATAHDGEVNSIRPLTDWLDYNGFTLRTKPSREFDDGEGRRKTRRSIGIELAIDALEMVAHVDHFFIFSGDGDLRPVVAALQRKGATVSVVSSLKTRPPVIADELRRQADNFIELDALRRSIERPRHAAYPR
jgi:uncharacterized LabA/DUF88 family protein